MSKGKVRNMNRFFSIWLSSGLLTMALILGCNEPAEQVLIPPQELPVEKNVLAAYHPVEFLTTELISAPLLTTDNHRHGWEQADCTRCHRSPASSQAPDVCIKCHGHNGVGDQIDTCASCHQVTDPGGAPATGQHLAHVERGPKDQQCIECHPGRDSNVHANGTVNVIFRDQGTYVPATDDGIGTCTISCHESRTWGGEGCGVCHGNPPSTEKHAIHLSQEDITCRDCHLDNQHDEDKNTGTIETGGVDYDRITGGCDSVCHEETEVWGCSDCHDYPPDSGNHDRSTHSLPCSACHQGHDHSYRAATQPLDFSNVLVNLAQGGTYQDRTTDGVANGTCSETGCHEPRDWGTDCRSCHGYPPTSGTHPLHIVDAAMNCQDCHLDNQHDLDDTSGTIDINGVEYNNLSGGCLPVCHEAERWDCTECHAYPPASGNHEAHTQQKISCKECHSDHEHSYKMASMPQDFSETSVQMEQGGTFDRGSELCSTPCHEPRIWGSSCADCHGNPPETGLHRRHTDAGAKCDTCHAGREHDLDRTSGSIDVGGVEYNNFTGGCTSTCHTGEVQWDCSSCHGYPPESGAHRKHAVDLQLGCRLCHQGHEHSYRAAEPNQQEFAPVEVGFTIRGSWDGQTCAGIGCHGDRLWNE